MKMLKKLAVIVVTLSLFAGCASTDEGKDRTSYRGNDCIHQPSIRGYTVLDDQNLIVDAAARQQYHVKLQRPAYGLRGSFRIGFVESPTGRICAGFSEIVFNGGMNDIPIRIASIRQVTPEEEEDLLIRFGIKEPEIESMPVPQEVEGADIEELDPDVKE